VADVANQPTETAAEGFKSHRLAADAMGDSDMDVNEFPFQAQSGPFVDRAIWRGNALKSTLQPRCASV